MPPATSCRPLGVARSWFYKWAGGDVSVLRARRAALAAAISTILRDRRGKDGSPRITAELRDEGWVVSVNTVAAVMAEHALVARPKRRRRSTTRPDRSARKAPDLVERRFDPPERPDQIWVGDLTEIPNDEGPFYRATVLDLHGRRIVGFAMSPHHDSEVAKAALCMAIAVRGGNVPARDHAHRPGWGVHRPGLRPSLCRGEDHQSIMINPPQSRSRGTTRSTVPGEARSRARRSY